MAKITLLCVPLVTVVFVEKKANVTLKNKGDYRNCILFNLMELRHVCISCTSKRIFLVQNSEPSSQVPRRNTATVVIGFLQPNVDPSLLFK